MSPTCVGCIRRWRLAHVNLYVYCLLFLLGYVLMFTSHDPQARTLLCWYVTEPSAPVVL